MSGRVDLHVHSTASDGQFCPAELVQRALQVGLAAIAITDHDTTEGVAGALEAARGTVLKVIPGVEISTDASGREVHVLGYYIRYKDPDLCSKLALFRDLRLERARRMVAKLGRMGLPLDWDRVREIAGDAAVGRPHIARALLEQGYISTLDEAFHLYIGRNGPAYADRFKLSPVEAVRTILAADGLPVLAHPLHATHLVPELARNGLAGLEVYYPGYLSDDTRFLLNLAADYDLIATGGSDFHGDVLPAHDLGGIVVPEEVVESLLAHRLRRQRESRAWRPPTSP